MGRVISVAEATGGKPRKITVEEAVGSQHPLKSIAWGGAQGAFDVGSILAAVGDWAKGPDWSPSSVRAGLRGEPGPNELLPKMAKLREQGMEAVTDPTNKYPIRAPETLSERALSGGGRGLPGAAGKEDD